MIMRDRHVSDDGLLEICLDIVDRPGDRQHVAVCPACEARRDALARLLADTADVAAAEADALFTAERLTRQRQRILQRLEQEGALGRVINFPAPQAHTRPLRSRPGTRWIATAAAAGLLI